MSDEVIERDALTGSWPRLATLIAAIFGLLAVAMGAFAAHGLKQTLSEYSLDLLATAVQYQFWHSLLLLYVATRARQKPVPSAWLKWSSMSAMLGVVCFSGSLYWLAITGSKLLVLITPLGGVMLLVAWCCVVIDTIKEA